jgi:hypothetical protein
MVKETKSRVFEAIVLMLAVAVAGRLLYTLLAPLLPTLAALVALAGIYAGFLRKRR